MYKKLRANIILNDERLGTFLLRSGTRTREGCALLSFLFNTILEVPASAVMQKKEIKGIQTGKREIKLFLVTDEIHNYPNRKPQGINRNS